jgi:DNA-binding transcriptional regulator/RsmH inhibitor MraZ
MSVVLTGTRLRLPRRFFAILQALDDRELWIGPLPGGSALVLCPSSSWSAYRRYVREVTRGEFQAERILLFGLSLKPVDPGGRVTLDLSLLKSIGVKKGGQAVLLGADERMELWSEKRWRSMQRAAARLPAPMGPSVGLKKPGTALGGGSGAMAVSA